MDYSSPDMLGLIAELNARRVALVLGRYARRSGGQLDLAPKTLDMLMVARRLHHRYRNGDYRHSPNELGKIKDLCGWLVQRHRDLSANPPDTPVGQWWDAKKMTSKTPPAAGTYPGIIQAIAEGLLDGE